MVPDFIMGSELEHETGKKRLSIWKQFSHENHTTFNDNPKIYVATPLWPKCEKATHTPKSGKMEFSGTFENSEGDLKGQISSPWCVLYMNGNLLKRRCPKWPRIAHLDICSPSYGQKKGRE